MSERGAPDLLRNFRRIRSGLRFLTHTTVANQEEAQINENCDACLLNQRKTPGFGDLKIA
jgi:hypothetical protein